jgi:hypothetical protein
MRPPTHDDPNAIPRNGTDVPWPEIDDPGRVRTASRHGREATASAADRQRRR